MEGQVCKVLMCGELVNFVLKRIVFLVCCVLKDVFQVWVSYVVVGIVQWYYIDGCLGWIFEIVYDS